MVTYQKLFQNRVYARRNSAVIYIYLNDILDVTTFSAFFAPQCFINCFRFLLQVKGGGTKFSPLDLLANAGLRTILYSGVNNKKSHFLCALLVSPCTVLAPQFCPNLRYFSSSSTINPYPTAFPYGNGMVLNFYQQQESSTTKTVHRVINKRLKTYV